MKVWFIPHVLFLALYQNKSFTIQEGESNPLSSASDLASDEEVARDELGRRVDFSGEENSMSRPDSTDDF